MPSTVPTFSSEQQIPSSREVVVRFHDGFRLDRGGVVADPLPYQRQTLEKTGIAARQLPALAKHLHRLVARADTTAVPLFGRPVPVLRAEAAQAAQSWKAPVGDPTAFARMHVKGASREDLDAVAADLAGKDGVLEAYVQPIPYPASTDVAPVTPRIGGLPGFFSAAPTGIDMEYARRIPGARGAGVRILDIEGAWRLDHEDLPTTFLANTPLLNPFDVFQDSHGTAVLGVLAAVANAHGVEGLVPDARIGVATCADVFHALGGLFAGGFAVASVIDSVASHLGPGDVLLIEQHYPGPTTLSLDDFNAQRGFVPVEHLSAEFNAIQRAVSRGVIVVEPAGNGSMDLDAPIFGGRYDRARRDSGAIVVGAGTAGGRAPMDFTNSGSRVDVQGWGERVTTTGYGDLLRVAGEDRRQWYTASFSGTSSASPVVASACASVQGALGAAGRPRLTPRDMRDLLVRTGTPQAPGRPIGPLPDLRRAFVELRLAPAPDAGWPHLAGGTVVGSPAIGRNADGRLEVVGVSGGGWLGHCWQTAPNNGWSGWSAFPSRLPTGVELRGDPAVVRNLDGRLEVFCTGSDLAVWHVWQTAPNNGWSDWSSLGGRLTSAPAVALNADGRVEVFARGEDGQLWRQWQRFVGWGWSGWHRTLPVRFTGKPAATRNADGRLEVFVRGADGTLRHVWQTSAGGDWSGGGAPGWRTSGDPAVARFGTGSQARIVLFATGTSGRLFHAWQTAPSNGWAATDDFGRGFADGSPVAVCESGSGGIHVFGRSPGGSVLERRLLPGQPWTEVRDLGGRVDGGPSAAVNADDRPEVVARGVDGRLVHRWGPF